MNKKNEAPVIAVFKERNTKRDEIIVLSTGYRAKLHGVSATLMEEVSARIKNPEIPTIYIEEKGRNEENPNDPKYLEALDRADKDRGIAALDAMVMFGVELVDDMPPDETWLPKLLFLQKRGLLDLSSFDLEEPIDKEFIFKRYIAIGSEDLALIGGSVTQEAISQAEASFPSNQGTGADPVGKA